MEIGNNLGIDLNGNYTIGVGELVKIYEATVDMCADIAETQSRVYTGEKNEAAGCYASASAILTIMKAPK